VRAGSVPAAQLLDALGSVSVTDGYLAAAGPLAAIARELGLIEGDRIDFERLTAGIQVERGRVRLGDSRLGSARYGDYGLAGSVGLDGTIDLAVQALLPGRAAPRALAGRREILDLVADASGRIPLDFTVSGTVADPKLKLDLRKLEETAAARGREKLKAAARKEAGRALDSAARRLSEALGGKKKQQQQPGASPDTARAAPAPPDSARAPAAPR
jgi:hypothetical protein